MVDDKEKMMIALAGVNPRINFEEVKARNIVTPPWKEKSPEEILEDLNVAVESLHKLREPIVIQSFVNKKTFNRIEKFCNENNIKMEDNIVTMPSGDKLHFDVRDYNNDDLIIGVDPDITSFDEMDRLMSTKDIILPKESKPVKSKLDFNVKKNSPKWFKRR